MLGHLNDYLRATLAATRRGAGAGFAFRPVDLVLPKGAAEPVEIHELLGLSSALTPEEAPLLADPALVASLPAWREMVVLFRAGRFAEAEAALAAARLPGDPLAGAYAARLASSGVEVWFREEPQMIHAWLRARHMRPGARAGFAALVLAGCASGGTGWPASRANSWAARARFSWRSSCSPRPSS